MHLEHIGSLSPKTSAILKNKELLNCVKSFLRRLPGHSAHILSFRVEFLAKSRANEQPEHRNNCDGVLHFHCTSSSILLDAVFAPHFTSPKVTAFTFSVNRWLFLHSTEQRSSSTRRAKSNPCTKSIFNKTCVRQPRHLKCRCGKLW